MSPLNRPSRNPSLARVRTRDELVAWCIPDGQAGFDPWLRWCLPDVLSGPATICHDIALIPREGRFHGYWVRPLATVSTIPEQDRVRIALGTLTDLLPVGQQRQVSLPQAHTGLAYEVLPLPEPGGDWEWLWTDRLPPEPNSASRTVIPPADLRLVELDDLGDAAELIGFTREHNPRVWAKIGTGTLVHWIGLRSDSHGLVAIGGAQREASGAAHLAGILTHRAMLGHGLGTRITRALTGWALADGGVSTLGVFSESAAAIRLYTRLGYRTAAAWHSVSVRKPR